MRERSIHVRLVTTLLVGGALAAGTQLAAHHSFGAMYMEADSLEIDGTIVEFQYKNPHSWVYVNGSEGGLGTPKVYAAEWVSTSQLEREGIEKGTLKAGDSVRVWGSPAKNVAEAKIHLKRIERSDGWNWRGRAQAR